MFSKNNREYSVKNFPVSKRKCYLIRSSTFPDISNTDHLSIDKWSAAYIRFENRLFYVLAGASQFDEIVDEADRISRFDKKFKVNKLEINQPKLLVDAHLEYIKEVTGHVHSIGVIILTMVSPTISSYSDHISVSVPVSSMDDDFDFVSNVGNLISHASWLHHQALNKGMLMRGAITIGSFVHEGNRIFGSALNNAVTMEEKIAVYPRVIIENKIVERIQPNLRLFLDVDQDGLFFVNYLRDTRFTKGDFPLLISKLLNQKLQLCDTTKLTGVYAK